MSDIERQIRERIAAFVQELSALVRTAAVAAVSEALGVAPQARGSRSTPPPRPRPRRPGRSGSRTSEKRRAPRKPDTSGRGTKRSVRSARQKAG